LNGTKLGIAVTGAAGAPAPPGAAVGCWCVANWVIRLLLVGRLSHQLLAEEIQEIRRIHPADCANYVVSEDLKNDDHLQILINV